MPAHPPFYKPDALCATQPKTCQHMYENIASKKREKLRFTRKSRFKVCQNYGLRESHLRKPSVRFSLTPISPLADFNATEMPSIGMSIEPTGVLISQRKTGNQRLQRSPRHDFCL
jgi:hypothetical protein